jgi:hypothetical protein
MPLLAMLARNAGWMYCLCRMSMIPMLDMQAGYAACLYTFWLYWLFRQVVLSKMPGNSGCIFCLALLAILDGCRVYDVWLVCLWWISWPSGCNAYASWLCWIWWLASYVGSISMVAMLSGWLWSLLNMLGNLAMLSVYACYVGWIYWLDIVATL